MNTPPLTVTERFSTRVANYIRFRPGYPSALLKWLSDHAGLGNGCRVADIGSGTGILTALLLETGAEVHAIEPNDPMREAAEELLRGTPGFFSHPGTAESTGLDSNSINLITAAQAWHWFRPQEARAEFTRILSPGGAVALIWNERLTEATPFLRDWEVLLQRYCSDYAEVDHRKHGPESLGLPLVTADFPNAQRFNLEGLLGRLLSSSYAPEAGHAMHAPMMEEAARLYQRHQTGGSVEMLYTTRVSLARI